MATGISSSGPEGYLPGTGQLGFLGLGSIAGRHAAASLGDSLGLLIVWFQSGQEAGQRAGEIVFCKEAQPYPVGFPARGAAKDRA